MVSSWMALVRDDLERLVVPSAVNTLGSGSASTQRDGRDSQGKG